jgi:hypothetical protein
MTEGKIAKSNRFFAKSGEKVSFADIKYDFTEEKR